jgi:hypothetical protein
LVDVWFDQEYKGGAFKKLLVVAVAEDDRSRRIFEDRFVSEIRKHGSEARASYGILPQVANAGEGAISEAIRGKGFDGVIISHYAGTDEESVYVPGRTRTEVRGVGHPRVAYDGHYWRTWETVSEPGYYDKVTTVMLETNIYVSPEGRLVWSARSQTFNPDSTLDLIDELSKAVVKDLASNGLL